MTKIHDTAIVSSKCNLGSNVIIGPYSVIHANTSIGDDCVIGSHCVIHPYVQIGKNNGFTEHVVIGGLPQDLKFEKKCKSYVVIEENNTFREFCTVHRGSIDKSQTRIASNCLLMCYSHVGHDSVVDNSVVLTNSATLGGFVSIGEFAVIGGNTYIHQYTRIGAYAMVSGHTAVTKDVVPFTLLGRDPVKHYKLNSVGIKRADIEGVNYELLQKAFRYLRDGRDIADLDSTKELEYLKAWINAESKRGIYGFLKR